MTVPAKQASKSEKEDVRIRRSVWHIKPMADAYTYIRFSTPEQQAGDSWRRQNEAVQKFIQEHGLIYKESAAFQDMGVSGYRGANLKNGLGKFLAEVDAGNIAHGSYLIVESVDRLSRQSLMDALGLVVRLVTGGVKVVTLVDQGGVKVLDADAGLPELILTLSTMQRANNESAMKSMRVKAAWSAKKENASNKPVSSRCPEWLAFNREKEIFEKVDDRVATIKKILELADDGIGRHRIVKYLNSNGYPSFRNPEKGWQSSSVAKILKNRALIGFYQPHRIEFDEGGRKKRVADGEEVPNYYPVVVDKDLFNRVSHKEYSPAAPLQGRQGDSLSNLFTGMISCAYCRAPMRLINKGPPPKGGRYLVCSMAVRGQGCKYRAWPYDDAEMYILAALKGLNIGAVLSGIDVEGRTTQLRNEISQATEALKKDEATLLNLDQSFSAYDGKISGAVFKKYEDLENGISAKRDDIHRLTNELSALTVSNESEATFNQNLLRLFEEMTGEDAQRNYLLRVRLRVRISMAVSSIRIRPRAKGESQKAPNMKKIHIDFKDGTTRTVVPIGSHGIYTIDGVRRDIGSSAKDP